MPSITEIADLFLTRLYPKRQADSRLLLISREGLTAYHWSGGRFTKLDRFNQDSEGYGRYWAFMATTPANYPVYVLVDVIEEEMKGEVIPRLRRGERQGVLQHRLERLFAGTPYRRAVSQGSGPEGEQILFSGLVNPGQVTPWLERLEKLQVSLAGIWSQQLLMRGLLQKIDHSSERALLVVLHSTGLRQTFFVRGRTRISRMTPVALTPDGMVDGDGIIHELQRTQRYLVSLRILGRGDPFDLFYLGGGVSQALASRLEGARLTVVDVRALGQQLGLVQGLEQGGLELLNAQLLLQRPPPSHYGKAGLTSGLVAKWRGMIRGLQRQAVVKTQEVLKGGGATVDPTKPVRRLGDLLLDRGLIARDQLQTALAEQRRSGESLGRILVQMGLVGESAMRDVLALALEQESVDLSEAPPQAEALAMVPKWFAVRHGILPILYDRQTKRMVVAMTNPMNASVLDMLQARLEPGTTVHPKLAGDADVAGAIDRYYGYELSVEGVLRELETGEVDLSTLGDPASQFSHPMVRLLNALLADAVKREASDIHIGPTAGFVRVRYRIDGILRQIHSFHKHLLPSLMVRIKVMGGMNIAETRIPQDGYISLDVTGKKISFRVSIQPTINGENAVFRILDLRREILSLGELGLTDHNLNELHRALRRNIGLVLVTGPTGSGKTSTLYSMVNHVNNVGINVMTLEDPVEYPIPTILQTSVNKAVGMDYAAGVKSLLWQDPDVILIGEIHDRETADMALQAAMTGHQVLATLHANTTLGAIPRLMNLGTHREFLIGTLNCIIAQRLVRRLCMACRLRAKPTHEERCVLGFAPDEEAWIYRSAGCPECYQSGYRGRLPVMEVLRVDNTFNDLIYVGAPRKEFMAHGKSLGLRTLAMDGVDRVRNGLTTLDELVRVVDMAEVYEKAVEPEHG